MNALGHATALGNVIACTVDQFRAGAIVRELCGGGYGCGPRKGAWSGLAARNACATFPMKDDPTGAR